MNWLIKQWFLLRYFLGLRTWTIYSNATFKSTDFQDGQWYQDDAFWNHTKEFTQKYGRIRYVAKLDGSFEDTSWPALWMVHWNSHYYEVDIELIKKPDKLPYLLYTMWVNPFINSTQSGCTVQRVKVGSKRLIRRLQTEFHEYMIDWNAKRIKHYIDGLLVCVIKNVPKGEMRIVAGKVSIEEITVYN